MTKSRGKPSSAKRVHQSSAQAVDDAHDGGDNTNTMEASQEVDSTVRILIASDNHIGFAERDPVRGEDSYNSFREVLEIARAEDVDMVLLAGDLFHENKPSRKSMFQAMRSLRMNCLGDKPCQLEVLGDQSVATEDSAVMHINYLDPEINVAIPVFSIHGNHDDPSGEGRLCALDILQVSGLLNYYGRVPESDHIVVRPVLLQKGTTKLALYGLSNVRDERLHRSFRHNQVKFMRPELYQDEWFNLIAVHQNHHGHSETNYLPENFIQNFFDFVVWGHEHECLIDPILNPEQDFHVCQPGSSVATSLCKGEAIRKHVGILSIRDRAFKMKKIPLKTVRPFVMRELVLADNDALDPMQKNKSDVIAYLLQQVEECICEANEQWYELHASDGTAANGNTAEESAANGTPVEAEPPLPLIRLRVDYGSERGAYEIENPQRFSQRFLGRVANAHDVVQFHIKKKKVGAQSGSRRTKGGADSGAMDSERPDLSDVRLATLKVASLVKQFLSKQTLQCLPENELEDAVTQFVEKDDKDAVKDFVKDHLESQVSFMTANRTTESTLNEVMERAKTTMSEQFSARQDKQELLRRKKAATRVSDFESSEEENITRRNASPETVRKPVARKAAAKKPAPRKRKRGAEVEDAEDNEDQEEEEEVVEEDASDVAISDSPPPKAKKAKAVGKPRAPPVKRKVVKPSARQTQLSFGTPVIKAEPSTQQSIAISSGSDDDDGFVPPPAKKKR